MNNISNKKCSGCGKNKKLSDFTERKQFLKACHYTNLQPLWHHENSEKGSKVKYRKRANNEDISG
jgi:hypothetical protein